MSNHQPTAGVLAPPPLIFGAGFAVGMLLQWLVPLRVGIGAAPPLGGAGVVLGAGLALWSFRELARRNTPLSPYEATTSLVEEGSYRFSRNPIYLALALVYAGLALWLGALWPLLVLPVVLWIMVRGVIEREEIYLERRFEEAYRRYKARVRRWI
ncbi:MAG: isoprenylcysteine carboxylmethyltransferase family protein [Aphanocapsa lilacina HA4352-LM1]|jgi:protein-S-isoprenylcysteine O-methyltransferase Ste14|nr:isoprenylcysteine carboxylmethyltransferase family protein [Aphanocapsa lilacina HA4352-LM1]